MGVRAWSRSGLFRSFHPWQVVRGLKLWPKIHSLMCAKDSDRFSHSCKRSRFLWEGVSSCALRFNFGGNGTLGLGVLDDLSRLGFCTASFV